MRPMGSKVRDGLILFVVAFILYNINLRPIATGDSVPAALTPIVLLTRGNLVMDEFNRYYVAYYQKKYAISKDSPTPYFFTATKYGYLSTYPVATGLLLTPFYAIPVFLYAQFQPTTAQWVFFAVVAEKIAASAITAATVVFFYLLSHKVGASRRSAIVLATVYGFATQAWVISSQALWQHGPGVFFILLASLVALDHRERPSAGKALLMGSLCAFSVAIRPTNILFCAAALAWMMKERPSYWRQYAVPAIAVAAALGMYNIVVFGRLGGGYGATFGAGFQEGFSGILLSPGRGLLIYFPLALFGIAGYLIGLREGHPERAFFSVMMAAAVLQILLFSKWSTWWGGYCYGPRYLTEIQPMLLLTAIPILESGHMARLRLLFLLCFAWSLWMQAVGAFLYPAGDWNGSPVNIDRMPARVWDWQDNPVSRDVKAYLAGNGPFSKGR